MTTLDIDYIHNGLTSLGRNSDVVAATLYDLGIRMPPNPKQRTHCCPVTQFVASHCPEGSIVLTVRRGAYIYVPGVEESPTTVPYTRVDLPDAVSDFIDAFDFGMYPELVEG